MHEYTSNLVVVWQAVSAAQGSTGIHLHTNACALQGSVIILFFMKQYVIDELRSRDYQLLKSYFDEQYGPAAMNGIYWIPIGSDILTDTQSEHKACQPHCFALDLDQSRMACELLVRSKNRMRCNCIHYATGDQRNWLIERIDTILNQLEIKA